MEFPNNGPGTRRTTLDGARFQHLTLDAINYAAAHAQRGYTMPKAQGHRSLLLPFVHAPDKWLYDPRTGSPSDVKAWHRIAMSCRKIPSALGPLHNRKSAETLGT